MDELQRANPSVHQIKYEVRDIMNFIDSLAECNIIVYVLECVVTRRFDPATNLGTPYGKNGIKSKIIQYLDYVSRRQYISLF